MVAPWLLSTVGGMFRQNEILAYPKGDPALLLHNPLCRIVAIIEIMFRKTALVIGLHSYCFHRGAALLFRR